MGVFDLYDQNACSIEGKKNILSAWTWKEYKEQKKTLGKQLVLVDMIGYPLLDSVAISDELFFGGRYPDGTVFALYCHSGGSSGYIQMQLAPMLKNYTFINIKGGIGSYQ